MSTKDILQEATMESQGHTGILQNFDPLESETSASKFRISIDWRTILSAVIFFLLLSAASIYFAYNAGAATAEGNDTSSSETLKRTDTSTEAAQQAAAPVTCPEVPASKPGSAIDVLGRVNLNTATAEDLQTLTGVGPATATRILDYRNEHGNFTSTDELMEVKGIGQATYDKLKDKLTIG